MTSARELECDADRVERSHRAWWSSRQESVAGPKRRLRSTPSGNRT